MEKDTMSEKRIRLTPRLQAAAEWVPQGAALCDVGTDHALLPAALLLEGRLDRAIASDIRPGPLERAARTAAQYGLTDRLALRLCPGLEGIAPGEADAVTICGMGGEMILHILEAAPWTKEGVTLILQPQRSQSELRRWLWGSGYAIQREKLVAEGERWYTLLLCRGGEQNLPEEPAAELVGHPRLWERQPERLEYLNYLLKKDRLLLERLSLSRQSEEKAEQLKKECARLEYWIEKLEKGAWPE
jgi:tRNA (adenine22-N1)-methyltransferase